MTLTRYLLAIGSGIVRDASRRTDERIAMLVIAVQTAAATAQQLSWAGRRHDDDGTESTGEPTPAGLFDAVFHALHDGEQVAIGFDCPLTAAADQLDNSDPATLIARAGAVERGPGVERLRHLVTELGIWRPWTIVTTSLPRWRATTSVLVWEAVPAPGAKVSPQAAIDAFYAMLGSGAQATADGATTAVLNLAAAAAVESGATADAAELTAPVLRVPLAAELAVAP
jgi:hypothetical protein